MKTLSKTVLVIGAASMIVALILRLAVKPIVLGLVPSSFLEFSIACFLLSIAINSIGAK